MGRIVLPAYASEHQRVLTWVIALGGTAFVGYYLLSYWRFRRQGYRFSTVTYEWDEEHLDAGSVAVKIGADPDRVFKTLVTRSDGRLLVHKHYERRLRKLYGDLVLDNFLPELSAFKLAAANRSPVQYHRQASRAARLTQNLSREILDRTDSTKRWRAA